MDRVLIEEVGDNTWVSTDLRGSKEQEHMSAVRAKYAVSKHRSGMLGLRGDPNTKYRGKDKPTWTPPARKGRLHHRTRGSTTKPKVSNTTQLRCQWRAVGEGAAGGTGKPAATKPGVRRAASSSHQCSNSTWAPRRITMHEDSQPYLVPSLRGSQSHHPI